MSRATGSAPSLRRIVLWVALGLAIVLLIGAAFVQWNNSRSAQLTSWAEGEQHGLWTARYSGYGQILGSTDQIVLETRSAETKDITHGGLVHTTDPCQDPSFSLTIATEEQLRVEDPNPWEVAWVLWNFEDDTRFYALVLKPNGWEVSKQDPAYPGNQRFIASGHEPTFPIGQSYRVSVTQDWPKTTITVDGEVLTTMEDTESAYRHGSIGLYTEDARVSFTDFDLPACSDPSQH